MDQLSPIYLINTEEVKIDATILKLSILVANQPGYYSSIFQKIENLHLATLEMPLSIYLDKLKKDEILALIKSAEFFGLKQSLELLKQSARIHFKKLEKQSLMNDEIELSVQNDMDFPMFLLDDNLELLQQQFIIIHEKEILWELGYW